MGINQISTFSFVSPKYFDKINLPADSKLRNPVVITNPLGEDTSVMRTTIIPSICEVLARNYNYRNAECAIFELANEYIPVEGEVLPNEPHRLGMGMYGDNDVDFYDIKGIVEGLMDRLGAIDVEFERPEENTIFDEVSAFHPGRVAVVKVSGEEVGIFGELHPDVLENYSIGKRAYVGKINITELMEKCEPQKTYKPLPKFPATTRDLSLICDDSIPVAKIEKAIKTAVGNILEKITLFDVYKGQQIEEGKKSVSYSISMRSHDGTLTDEQADKAMDKALKSLKEIDVLLRE